jgi:hypothetical protein
VRLVPVLAITLALIPWVAAAEESHRLTSAVAKGHHERLETDHGAVHVWTPDGYRAETAAVIVYVHGYWVDADHAWSEYQLAEQFALSAANAVFIVCEAPRGSRPKVQWTSLGELLAATFAESKVARPPGPVLAIGHSGAYRTLAEWLDDPLLDHIVMIDGAYSMLEDFAAWVRASPSHHLIDVTEDTVVGSEELARELADVSPVLVDRFPLDDRGWPPGARDARLLTVRAQWSHMELVTAGIVLPLVIRLLPVEVLADAPWDAPIGDLP